MLEATLNKLNEIIEQQAKRIEGLEGELAKLIDLLKLPSLFPMLSLLEKDSIKHSEQALKGK